jgi:hypothetical protein
MLMRETDTQLLPCTLRLKADIFESQLRFFRLGQMPMHRMMDSKALQAELRRLGMLR